MNTDSDDQDDDAPTQDGTVESAAAAIAELMKNKPQEEEEGEAAPAPATTPEAEDKAQKPDAPDPVIADAARKAEEAEAAKLQYAAALNHMVPQLQAAIAGEFTDIRSPADLARLQATDPARYNRLVLAQNNLKEAQQRQAGLAAQESQAAAARRAAWAQEQIRLVGEILPELHDAEKGPLLARKVGQFALKSGYTPQQILSASATDFAMLHRAMKFEELEAGQAQARAKAAHAPRVSEPGTRGTDGKATQIEGDFARLKKSGRTEDAAAVFRSLLK